MKLNGLSGDASTRVQLRKEPFFDCIKNIEGIKSILMGGLWWLRTSGLNYLNAVCVSSEDEISLDGRNMDNFSNGIRTSLWLKIG